MSVSIRLLGFVWIAVMALACSSRGNGAPAPGSDMNFTVNPDGSVTYHNWECEPTQMYTCKGPADCAGAGTCQADRHTLSVCMCGVEMPDTGTPPMVDSATPPPPDASTPDTSTPPPPPPPGQDQCLSASDRAAMGDVDAAGSACRLTCLATGGANCYMNCVKQLVSGISNGCLDCYAEKEQCITPCALSCLGDDTACTNCKCGRGGLATQNCVAKFDTCTGVPTNVCN